jgi:hypothetical protein
MTKDEAIGHLLAAASAWADNKQEGFSRRITTETTDEECAAIAADSGEVVEDAIELRAFERAAADPTNQPAIDCLLLIAASWNENTEEGFSERIRADMSDDDCKQIADSDGFTESSEVIEVRDIWRAVDLLLKDASDAVASQVATRN